MSIFVTALNTATLTNAFRVCLNAAATRGRRVSFFVGFNKSDLSQEPDIVGMQAG